MDQGNREEIKGSLSQSLASETGTSDEKRKVFFKRYIFWLSILFLLVSSFSIGYQRGLNSAGGQTANPVPFLDSILTGSDKQREKEVDFSLFWKVWDLMKKDFIDKDSLDARTMVYGAIRGMVSAAGDPYTNFLDPKETKDLTEEIGGSFDGIGAELGMRNKVLTVISPLEGSPAQKAGLRSGDKILKIDDKLTSDLTIDQGVDLIRGKKGTTVKLTIFREGDEATQEISVVRDTIEIKSVELEFKDPGLAYVKINNFGEETDKEFRQAANQIISNRSKGIILDLRNNPGGLLDKAVDVANLMIPKGKVVVTQEESNGRKDDLKTSGGDKLSSLPTVVLINEGSASAAEILAGALKEDQGIKLIGKKSFGKGSVQEFMPLPGNSSVKITVAKWLTPQGNYIMEKGISPDIEVEMTAEDYKNDRDPQLEKAQETLQDLLK